MGLLGDLITLGADLLGAHAALFIGRPGRDPEERVWSGLSQPAASRLYERLQTTRDLREIFGAGEAPRTTPDLELDSERISAWIGRPVESEDGTNFGWFILLFLTDRLWTAKDTERLERLTRQAGAQLEQRERGRRLTSELNILRSYGAYFERGPDLLIRLAPDASVAALSGAWEAVLGHTLEELRVLSRTLIHPDDQDKVGMALRELLTGQSFRAVFQYRLKHRDGRWRTLEVIGVNIDGTLLGSARDVTPERQFATTLAAIADAQRLFIQGRPADEVLQGMLRSVARIAESPLATIGDRQADPDGAPWLRIVATEGALSADALNRLRNPVTGAIELRERRSMIWKVFEEGQPLLSNDLDRDVPDRWQPPGGQHLHAFLGMPIRAGEELIGVLALLNRDGGYRREDMTSLRPMIDTVAVLLQAIRNDEQRRASTDALRESEARFRGVFEGAHDAKLILKADGTIERANAAAVRLYGYSIDELEGLDVRLLVAPSRRARALDGFLARANERFAHAPGHTESTLNCRKDGTEFPVEFSVAELPLRERRYAAVIHDLTDRMRVERLKSEFVSTVSHELRTPLTAIRGGLGLLAQQAMDLDAGERQTLIHTALRNAERLNALLNDILDMEKVSSGKMEFSFEPVSLGAAVQDAMVANSGYAALFSTSLRMMPPVEHGLVMADPQRLAQVLNNFISNAAKHSSPGTYIELRVARRERSMFVEVRDHGPGVPAEFLPRLFEPFSQADGSNTRARGGTGLGLSISKAIAEHMGGTIGYREAPGGGALFWLEMPCIEINQS